MAKKIDLKLGNREIKPPKVIEETHATAAQPASQLKEVKEIKGKRQRAKKDWKRRTVLMEAFESEKVDTYIEEQETNFNTLIRSLLVEKGILENEADS